MGCCITGTAFADASQAAFTSAYTNGSSENGSVMAIISPPADIAHNPSYRKKEEDSPEFGAA